ncbi:MAG: PilZ domain-containing protein [Croceibacterium sp.]
MKHESFPPFDEAPANHARRGDRVSLAIVAEVKIGFGPWRSARLQDVSVSGFRLVGISSAVEGCGVRIRIPGLEVLSATIRRRHALELGCEFERPLSVYVLEHMARHRT